MRVPQLQSGGPKKLPLKRDGYRSSRRECTVKSYARCLRSEARHQSMQKGWLERMVIFFSWILVDCVDNSSKYYKFGANRRVRCGAPTTGSGVGGPQEIQWCIISLKHSPTPLLLHRTHHLPQPTDVLTRMRI
jgi:hypothetical protein